MKSVEIVFVLILSILHMKDYDDIIDYQIEIHDRCVLLGQMQNIFFCLEQFVSFIRQKPPSFALSAKIDFVFHVLNAYISFQSLFLIFNIVIIYVLSYHDII